MYKKSLFAICSLAMINSNSLASDKLDEVFISTAKSNQTVKDLAGSITVITKDDIEKTNATNIKDVLVKTTGIVEGVNSASTNGRKSISIRGLDSSFTLILVNGKRVNPTDGYIKHSDYQYSWVPVDMIERIEVIKGPKSSIYGSQAMGGVVNIITKKQKGKISAEVDALYGISGASNGGNEYNLSGNVAGNITDKLSFIIGVNRLDREDTYGEGIDSFTLLPINNQTYVEGLETTNGSLALSYDIDDTQNISATYLKGKETRELKTNPNYYDLDRDMYSLSYKKSFKDIAFNLDYVNSQSDNEYDDAGSYNYIHKLTDSSIKGEVQISKFKDNYLILGAEASKEEYERENISGSSNYDFEAKTKAYYFQNETELGDFIFTLGARLDDHDNFGSEVSPNIGLVYKLAQEHRIKANYGEGFKAPSLQESSSEYKTYSHGYYYGNPDLEPEKSKSYELSYEYYGDALLFKTAIFYTDLENLIAGEYIGTSFPFGPGYSVNEYKYVNVEEANIKGFEAEVDFDLNEIHMLNANYTYLKTEDETTGEELMYKPKNTINLGLTSEFENGYASYFSANYIGTQRDSENEKVGGYTTYDFQVSKKINDDLTVRFGMDNITDKEFEDGEPYYIKSRFTYVGLNYKF